MVSLHMDATIVPALWVLSQYIHCPISHHYGALLVGCIRIVFDDSKSLLHFIVNSHGYAGRFLTPLNGLYI